MDTPAGETRSQKLTLVTFLVWAGGLAAGFLSFGLLHQRIINVVTYQIQPIDAPWSWRPFLAPVVALGAAVFLGMRRRWLADSSPESAEMLTKGANPRMAGLRAAWPLALTAGVGALWLAGSEPSFVTFCLVVMGLGWSIDRLGQGVSEPAWLRRADRIAPAVLMLAIAASTVWHTLMQIKFWEHFMLGYADFGSSITELEHCLPWKDVGPARFSDTRLRYHCELMLYLLTPFYALVRSPVFLMVVGPLALNLAAIPFYQLAKQRAQSATLALLVALAWLALPSVSRLPYSNTYGFESVHLAVPWLALMIALAQRNRWAWAHLCLAAAVLCQETVCGVAFGWGVYLILWEGRRRDGVWIAALSLGYLLLCTLVVIPHFAAPAQYARVSLFGDLTPGVVAERLTRPRVLFFLLASALPLLPALTRRPRLVIATLPTLLLVLLLQEQDYLNIKYWHQSSILPVIFAAATIGVTSRDRVGRLPAVSVGPALGMLVAILLFHQWMGSSPIAQAQRVYALHPRLQAPDPRLAIVEYVRVHFPAETTAVIATERLAAHFTDYRAVHPVSKVRLADMTSSPHVLIVDRSDTWDRMVRERQTRTLLSEAESNGYALIHTEGPVLILTNRPGGSRESG